MVLSVKLLSFLEQLSVRNVFSASLPLARSVAFVRSRSPAVMLAFAAAAAASAAAAATLSSVSVIILESCTIALLLLRFVIHCLRSWMLVLLW